MEPTDPFEDEDLLGNDDIADDYITISADNNSIYAYDINSNWTTIDSTISTNNIWINDTTDNKVVINAPLEVDGRDVLAELDEMRDALILIKRDVNMEEKYPELKRLKDEYEAALEKYKTFDAIKESK